jgi:hypothetical protein
MNKSAVTVPYNLYGLPVIARWRESERHQWQGEGSVWYAAGDNACRRTGTSPTFMGCEMERILEPEEWKMPMLLQAQRACEAEYESAVRGACNPVGVGDLPDAEILKRAKKARMLAERAWRFATLASQLRRQEPMMQHHIEYLLGRGDQ